MNFELTSEQQWLQGKCRALAADFATRSAAHDRDASHPVENYRRLREEGFLALTIHKEWGGQGASLLDHLQEESGTRHIHRPASAPGQDPFERLVEQIVAVMLPQSLRPRPSQRGKPHNIEGAQPPQDPSDFSKPKMRSVIVHR